MVLAFLLAGSQACCQFTVAIRVSDCGVEARLIFLEVEEYTLSLSDESRE
jgi:hypothetical protein